MALPADPAVWGLGMGGPQGTRAYSVRALAPVSGLDGAPALARLAMGEWGQGFAGVRATWSEGLWECMSLREGVAAGRS